jgi:ketosteroid isomerase-like protein
MSGESTTPNLVELTRRAFEAVNRRDFDAMMSFYGPESVWDASSLGTGTFEGTGAIRRLFEDWIGAYDEFEARLEEILDLGNGVVFAVNDQKARPVGSTGYVRTREAYVYEYVGDVVARLTVYSDIDEARAVAERLAESRE